jgi:hypothetical protein
LLSLSPFSASLYLAKPFELIIWVVAAGSNQQMGRTVPSFRIVLAEEKQEWKAFRAALAKKERKDFDDMWDIPTLYITACSNSVQLALFHPIIMSILFHHYKQLKECMEQVEQMGIKVESSERAYPQQWRLFDF